MRRTTVLGLIASVLAVLAMATVHVVEAGHGLSGGGPLAVTLGAPKADAPLVRHPAPGVQVRIGRRGFGVATRPERVAIRSVAARAGGWTRYEHGIARTTSFGRETVVVTPSKTEQFLTVDRSQGTRTWRWRLDSGRGIPRVGDDGAVAFLADHELSAMHVEPVAILDQAGHDVTPSGLRWSVAQDRRGWLLELRLDDSKLPLPYVIDPAVSYRQVQVSNNGAAGASSITMSLPAGVANNDLLFMHIAARGGSNMTINTPAGWTQLQNTNATTVTRLATFYRIASSEPGSYNVTFGGGTPTQQAVGAITAYYGVKSSSALDVNGATSTGNSAIPSATTITVAANSLVIAAFSHGTGNGTTGSAMFTTAAGMNERYDAQSQNATAGNRSSLAGDDILTAGAGATGAKSVTASASARWVAHQVAFNVDDVNPTGSTTFPAGSGSYNGAGWAAGCATAGVCGAASDADSAVQKVEVSIRQGSGNFWNGSSFASASEVWNLAGGTTSWSYAFNSFPADGSYTVRVQVTDLAGNAAVVSTVAFTYDGTAPALPTSLASSPVSPANNNSPAISGSAEAGSTVKIYTTGSCTGAPAATGTSAAFATGITVAVSDDSSATFKATATDAAGNVSGCSSSSVTYVEDSTAPALPSSLASTPAGPANNNSPAISGSAEAGSTVKIYTTGSCTGAPAATGTAASFATGITVAVSDDTSTTFKATATDAAGNVSGCSTSYVTYVEDSTAPALPSSLGSSPASPANNNSPAISGSAEAGSTVKLYTTGSCTGAPAATGSAAAFSSPGLAVSVSDDSSTTFKATATDAAGNISGCSSSSVTYVEDSSSPALPSSLASTPAGPANNNSPAISGLAEAGSTAKLYSTSDCSGAPTATGTAAAFGSPGITVAVSDDYSTTFKATATDAAGNVSGCSSSSVTYVEDSTAPALPASLASTPAGPANNNSPAISGTAEAGSTVKIYTTGSCTGAPTATGTAAAFASGITVAVSDNSSTTFNATATDAAGNVSGCSSSSVTYVEDSTAPALPSSLASTPAGPANNNSPAISGSAEAGSTVKLYTTSSCTGAPATTGTAAAFSSPGLTVSVSDDSTTTFKATATDAAGNVFGCSSSSVTYVEDSTAPALPSSLASTPAGPANNNSPAISGSAEASSTVKLYTTASCTGAPAATDTAAAFSSPGITVAVSDDTSTTFKATATDAAGNVSGCSSSSVAYVEDSTAPALPASLASTPAGPANDNSPAISGTAEAGSTVKLYTTGSCTGAPTATGTAAAFAAGITVAVADDSTTTFKATATDASGNVSGCSSSSVTYVEDSTAPALPSSLGSTPAGPANDNSPAVSGNAEAGSTVKIYTTGSCTGAPAATGTAAAFATGITVAVSDDSSTTFKATATDAAGNVSGCSSSSVTYVEDSTAPALPSSLGSSPAGPANDNAPKISGSAEAGSTVKLYTTIDCSGSVAATGSAASFSPPGIAVAVSDDSSTTFKATATDAAGNVSSCSSSSVTYVEDSTAPALPASLGSNPVGPANDNTPDISGSAEAGSTVKLYTTSDCSGSLAATGSAATFSSPGLTVAASDDSSTIFKATATDAAGNVSGCSSSSVAYVEDSTAPTLPASLASTPAGPANDNSPAISGTAEAGSTVKLYTTGSCTGAPTATGSAAAFATGITQAVADDSTTTFKATATDLSGNVSGCSSSSVTYVEDSTAPSQPSGLGSTPASPANDNAPKISGSAEAGSMVKLYTTSDCSGSVAASGSAATFSSPGLTAAVTDDSTTTFKATATDAAGNVSACSSDATYVEDSTPPSTTIAFPANGADYSPSAWDSGCGTAGFCGTASDGAGSGLQSVKISIRQGSGNYFDGSTFSSASELYLTASGTASWEYDFAASQFPVDGAFTIHVTGIDNAGNVEAFSSRTFVFDSSPPSAPSLSFSSLTNASVSGQTVYFRGGAAGGFTVTTSSSDAHSGIAGYTFPALGSGWSASQSGMSDDYTFTAGAVDPVEPNDVTAQNGAGLTASTSFTVTRDSSAPVSTISCDGTSCSGNWYTSGVSISLTASDGESGVEEIRYTTDGSDPSPVNGTVYSAPFSLGATATVRFRAYDEVGNEEAVASQLVRIDDTAPNAPVLTLAESPASPNQHVSGTTLFYNPQGGNSGSFTVSGTTADPQSGIDRVNFPALAGMTGGGGDDSASPYQDTYSWTASSSASGSQSVTAYNNAGLSAASSLTVTPDTVAPSGGSVDYPDGYTSGSVTITTDDGTDSLSGVNAATAGLERDSTTLVDGVCDPFTGSWSPVSSPDTTIVSGNCYRYRHRVSDFVGNEAVYTSPNVVKVSTGAPSAPSITLSETTASPNQHVAGGTLYYNPSGSNSGTFTVSASIADSGGSGIDHVSFPALSGMTGGGDDSASPFQGVYDWSSGSSASGPQTVTVHNDAGLTSSATFMLTVDATPPSGQSATVAGGYYTSLSVPVTLDDGADTLSGVDAASGVVERQAGTLSNGSCGSWSGGWSPVALVGGADTSVLSNRCYRYRYAISDRVGNQASPSSATLDAMVDATSPVTSDDGPAGWQNSAVAVTLSVLETGSGVASTQYRVDGGSFQGGSSVVIAAPSDHSNDGVHTIDYRSTDNAGNAEALRSATVRIDTTLPMTTDDAPSGWQSAQATVSMSAADALSGIASTQYRVDGGAFQTGTSVVVPAPADHSNDGVHTIDYRSTDNAGNSEPLHSASLRIDTTLPMGSLTAPAASAHVNGNVAISAGASDVPSGVASVEFFVRPNGAGSFTSLGIDMTSPYDATWDSTGAQEGDADLKIVVLDNAGFSYTSAIRTIVLDNPPAPTLDDPGADLAATVTLTATSQPDTAQVAFERRPAGGGSWTQIGVDTSAPFAADFDTTAVADGDYELRAVATDLGGSSGTSALRSPRVDNTGPSVSLDDPANGQVLAGPNVYLGATAGDTGSGISSVRFEQRLAGGSFTTVGTDTSAPYEASWDASALSGNYELRAIATDAAGNATATATVSVVVDNSLPSVTLRDPGSLLHGVVPLTAAAPNALVSSISFERKSAGGAWVQISLDTTRPWGAAFDTKDVADGLYDLRAQALDANGHVLTSHSREGLRVDNTAPVVVSTTPPTGATVSSADSIVVVASEGVASVESASLDGNPVNATISDATVTFPTGALGPGRHLLAGNLLDPAGNVGSFQVAFTVQVVAHATLVLQVQKPKVRGGRGQKTFVVVVALSTRASVQATLLSPAGRKLRTVSASLGAGQHTLRISVPAASLPPGRYTILVVATAADGTKVSRRVQVTLAVKHKVAPSDKPAARAKAALPIAATLPPPDSNGAMPRTNPASERPATPTVTPKPKQHAEPAPKAQAEPLEAAGSYVSPKQHRTAAVVVLLLSLGGALAFLIKIELARVLGSTRKPF